jgi:DNA-binding NtrC family response regulator
MDDANKFDLLLADVVLPGAIDGPSIAKEAHERDPSLKIVYMSDHIKDFKLDYSGGGMEINFIQKPFSYTQLSSKLRSSFEQSGAA